MDGSRQIASLIHQWDHFAVDYILLLTFPIDTDVRLKSLLLGASFLIVSNRFFILLTLNL